MKLTVAILVLVAYACADLYMHNPRGCNDRLNEANENRNNANRLFDSQNNAKGGYCYGPAMSYYEGSLLSVEWTNQHGCGQNPKMYCNLVVQYMCSNSDAEPTALVRDGTTTDTIPNDATGPTALDANGELKFGMHEPREFYTACQTRERNKGLWIADRADPNVGNLNGNNAVVTRQNNNGGRRGYECPEERDYYPYWVASPCKDVAILTHDESWCSFYKKESQNVKSRFRCLTKDTQTQAPQNMEPQCLSAGNQWVEEPAWKIPAPDCVKAPWGRDNQLGNELSGAPAMYNMTLPVAKNEACIKDGNCNCVLRLRYNISTSDMGENGNRPDAGFIDWTANADNSPVFNRNGAKAIVGQGDATGATGFELATDTSQFGRTFQDRSYVFHILPRPSGVAQTQRIFNLNVRGKRGNIVQAYPAVEYDFIPQSFTGRANDLIHFQWTGCDTNPAGNAGEGTAQTDRSNMVQVAALGDMKPATDGWIDSHTPLFESKELRLYMAMLGQTNCLTYEQLKAKNANNQNAVEADVQNCMKLNAAPRYFDAGLVKMNKTGTFHYMSSRNNNFSNRTQRGQIDINPLLPTWAIAIVVIGAVAFVISGVVAGMVLYARSHPHSGIANAFSKI
jgi:hypothetical protein